MLGLPGWKLLTSTDPFEIAVLQAMLDRASVFRGDLANDQAVRIANAVGKALTGKD